MSEHPEDIEYAAESRRRRRVGIEPMPVPLWPTPRFDALEDAVAAVTLANRDVCTAHHIVEVAKVWVTEPATPGAQARAEEAAEALLADLRTHIARARGTREPGEDDA